MPILYSIYNDGDIRMQVTEEEVLYAWKHFFSTGMNWKDVAASYEEYQGITDRQHLSNAKRNPIKFLKASGKGFFVEREGCAIVLCEEFRDVIASPVMAAQMKDVLEYRTMEYYRRRYVGE